MNQTDGVGEQSPGPTWEERFAALLANVREMVVCCTAEGEITFVNDAIRTHLGYDGRSLVGRNVTDFLHPEDLDSIVESMARWADRAGQPRGEIIRVRAADDTWHPLYYDSLSTSMLGASGTQVITLQPGGDADRESGAVRALLVNEDRVVRLASAFLNVPYEDFDKGLDAAITELAGLEWVTRISVWLADGSRVALRTSWDAAANAPRIALPDRVRITDLRMLQLVFANEEVRLTMPWTHGDEFEVERMLFEQAGTQSVIAMPMAAGGEVLGTVVIESTLRGVAFDATHTTTLRSAAAILAAAFLRHDAERDLAEQARTDRVTGLANRWAFDNELAHALLKLAAGTWTGFGVAIIDLDRFKLVNDSLGHLVGDQLLADVANRFRSVSTPQTTLARLGGDEFLVLVGASPDQCSTLEAINELIGSLSVPFDIDGTAMAVTASAGVLQQSDADVTPGEMLRWVDLAVGRAKLRGGDAIELDEPATRVGTSSRLRRIAELHRALADDEFEVHYQGEWDLLTGRIVGAEALVRWRHPTEGLVGAADFIPLVESTGMIRQLGQRVLSAACADAAPWVEMMGPGGFVLRVNVAAEQLRGDDLLDQVADALADSGLPAEALCLELTESTLLADPARSSDLFAQLRAIGVGLAIDDFGTGYSSILQLKQLPLSALKIDQGFVAGLPDDESDRAIVRATLELAQAFAIGVTAEGVETEAQRRALIELGCHRAQGFLMARPEPRSVFATRVAAAAE